jgi:hypothetical protein
VYIVVPAAVSGSSSREAQSASLNSGCPEMSRPVRTVLRSSASTWPAGPTSSEPNGMSPASRALARQLDRAAQVAFVGLVHRSGTIRTCR